MRTLNIFALTFIACTLFLTLTTQNVHAASTESLSQGKKEESLPTPDDENRFLPQSERQTEKTKNLGSISCDNPACIASCMQQIGVDTSCCNNSLCVGGTCIWGWCVGSPGEIVIADFLVCMTSCI